MNSYAHLDDLEKYYTCRALQCGYIAQARRAIWVNRKKKDQTLCLFLLLNWAEAKWTAEELMPTLSNNWERLHGQMHGKQGAK